MSVSPVLCAGGSVQPRTFPALEYPNMALVSYVSNDEATDKIKPVFEGMEKKIGAVPNIFRALAHYPEMLEAFLSLNSTLPKTKLNGKLRELAYIKTSELNG